MTREMSEQEYKEIRAVTKDIIDKLCFQLSNLNLYVFSGKTAEKDIKYKARISCYILRSIKILEEIITFMNKIRDLLISNSLILPAYFEEYYHAFLLMIESLKSNLKEVRIRDDDQWENFINDSNPFDFSSKVSFGLKQLLPRPAGSSLREHRIHLFRDELFEFQQQLDKLNFKKNEIS